MNKNKKNFNKSVKYKVENKRGSTNHVVSVKTLKMEQVGGNE